MTTSQARSSDSSAAALANAAAELETTDLGNRPERLTWLQDAGFGMFIHWSLDSQLGCVISHTLAGASRDYQDRFYNELPRTFNPTRYDPFEIAALARLAGMKYIVFTTKHHSGFCMWDTKTTPFNIMNTPYARDLLAEYVEATRRAGLAVGFYYSPEDWWFLRRNGLTIRRLILDADGRPTGYSDSLTGAVREAYEAHVRQQCTELMTRYGPVDVIFFDGQIGAPAKETCWTLQPNILVTRGAIPTPEQTVPGLPPEGAWESCVTMGTQWACKPTNETYKSGGRCIELLIETRAKGGALLLNVGPKPDGTLPEPQEARLREIALWHFVNGEAISGTRPWIVTNEGDIWFTRRDDTLYAFLTQQQDWTRGTRREFVLRSVDATPTTEIAVLGQSGELVEYAPASDASARFQAGADGLRISVVRAQRLYNDSKWPNPVVVRLTGVKPALIPPVVETCPAEVDPSTGDIILTANLHSLGDAAQVKVGFEYRPYAGFVEELFADTWQRTDLSAMDGPGEVRLRLAGPAPGVYQFRALVEHPRIAMRGDHLRFQSR